MNEDVTLDYIQLLGSDGVGSVSFYKLLKTYGSASEALKVFAQRGSVFERKRAKEEMEKARKSGVKIITFEDEEYPDNLRELNDAPPLLYLKGRIDLLKYPASIGIVGSRNASIVSRKIASRIAYDLTNADVLVVSGMARGIDSAAHKGALYAKNKQGPTIAVLGTGVDICYPAENKDLYEQIASQGLLVSEFKLSEQANATHFPRRNRIVAGLSCGILVVEASLNSGSLITARLGLEQGKDIFAVPASPLDSNAAGTNKLIKEGAILTQDANDILQTIAITQNATLKINAKKDLISKSLDIEKKERIMHEQKKADVEGNDILSFIGVSGIEQDELIRHLAQPTQNVLVTLTELELEGLIERRNGSFLVLTKEGLRYIK